MRFRMNRESERLSELDFSESEGLSFVAGPGFGPATSGSQAPLLQSLCWFAQSLADRVSPWGHPISANHRESGIASDFCRANVSSFRPRASAASPGPSVGTRASITENCGLSSSRHPSDTSPQTWRSALVMWTGSASVDLLRRAERAWLGPNSYWRTIRLDLNISSVVRCSGDGWSARTA